MVKSRALVLLSGGLDSLLASKLLKEQVEIEAIWFKLPFIKDSEARIAEFCNKERIKLEIIDCTKGRLLQEYLDILRRPKYGYGVGINPCVDCHIWILKKAKEYANKKGIEIIATGEVLGERPMSQTNRALKIVDKEVGEILRPLSAKLLPITGWEKNKIIDRSRLLDIQGRNRSKQIELAEDFGINYPSPGGGCLLCEPELALRLEELFKNKEKISELDIELIKIGRHIDGIVLGRNKQECEKLEELKKRHKQGILIIPRQSGPSAFLFQSALIEEAKELIRKYSKNEVKEFEVY